jgi:hypothetical protein
MPAIFQKTGVHFEPGVLWQRVKERSVLPVVDETVNKQLNRFERPRIPLDFEPDWNRSGQKTVGEFVLSKNFKPGGILFVRHRLARRQAPDPAQETDEEKPFTSQFVGEHAWPLWKFLCQMQWPCFVALPLRMRLEPSIKMVHPPVNERLSLRWSLRTNGRVHMATNGAAAKAGIEASEPGFIRTNRTAGNKKGSKYHTDQNNLSQFHKV